MYFYYYYYYVLSGCILLFVATQTVCDAYTIRPARVPQDLPALQACRRRLTTSNQKMLPSSWKKFQNATAVGNRNVNCTLLILNEHDNNSTTDVVVVAGSVDTVYNPQTRVLHIRNLFVAPLYRGKGYGRALMEHVMRMEQQSLLPVHRFQLTVQTQNHVALQLYRQKLGFRMSHGLHEITYQFAQLFQMDLLVEMEYIINE